MTAIASTEADLQGELQFFTPAADVAVATKAPATVTTEVNGVATEMPFKAYAAMMRDSVKHMNERNGFVAAETPKAAVENTTAAPAEATRSLYHMG